MNRTWVEVEEQHWTEEVRALTRSVSLERAQRTPAGLVRADIDLADGEPLPAALEPIVVNRRTHLAQLKQTYREGLEGRPLDDLKLEAEQVAIADWGSKAKALLVDEVLAIHYGHIVAAPAK
jgi:hypothetical protein